MTPTRQLTVFFAITFAFTWAVAAWMILAHIRIEFTILASCGPTIGALITHRLATGNFRAFRWNVSWARTLAAGALGVALIMTAYVVLPATAIVDAGKLSWGALASLGMYNYSTILGGPLFEEPGWRGFALPRLEPRFGPALSSLLLGLIWATWHVPFFFYPGWTTCPMWIYFLIVTGLAVIMTLGANLARFGVIAPIFMHAIFNTNGRYLVGLFGKAEPGSGGFMPAAIGKIANATGWNPHVNLSFELLVALGGWTVALLVLALTKGRLGYSREGK
jgi:membrane protease YdiL (CAAX protease family)